MFDLNKQLVNSMVVATITLMELISTDNSQPIELTDGIPRTEELKPMIWMIWKYKKAVINMAVIVIDFIGTRSMNLTWAASVFAVINIFLVLRSF